ncbi:MAG: hypothetical protein WBX15_00190 [Thermoanaerobaculia bacterium]
MRSDLLRSGRSLIPNSTRATVPVAAPMAISFATNGRALPVETLADGAALSASTRSHLRELRDLDPRAFQIAQMKSSSKPLLEPPAPPDHEMSARSAQSKSRK